MTSTIKKTQNNNLITTIFYALIGMILIILRSSSLGILMSCIGGLFIVLGVLDLVQRKDTTKGFIEIAIGVIIIVCGWTIASLVLLIFGILLIIKGLLDVIGNYKKGTYAIISSVLTIIVGITLVIAKWTLVDLMCIVAGIIFIVNAILMILGKNTLKTV